MQNKHCNGSNLRGYDTSILHYPPILPIVYYEGIDKWAAGMQLRDRVLTEEGVEDYIPNFRTSWWASGIMAVKQRK